jgi:hypothetical protein
MSKIHKAVNPDKSFRLYGNTYPYRDLIRAAGGKWNAKDKEWVMPADTDLCFLPAGVLYVPPSAEEIAAERAKLQRQAAELAAAAKIPPRRPPRDGRCCDHAEAYWPSDDPYAHYGPAQYRCKYHGLSRSNYSGT